MSERDQMNAGNQNTRPQRRHNGPMGGPPMAMPGEKAKNFKVSLKRLIRYLRPHKINLIVVIIFAILSTTFTIAAPKISAKATNKLQDGYMAKNMLSAMMKAQDTGFNEITKNIGDTQQKIVDQLKLQMAKLQSMGAMGATGAPQAGGQTAASAQASSGNKTVKGSKAAASGQAASGNKTVAGIQPGAAAGNMPSIDAKSIAAMQEFLKLPLINSITDRQEKIDTTIKVLDAMANMPSTQGSGTAGSDGTTGTDGTTSTNSTDGTTSGAKKLDADTMAALKEFLQLPQLSTLKDGNQKADVSRKIISLGDKLQSAMGSSIKGMEASKNVKLTENQINGALEAIRETNGEYDFKYIGMIALILIGIYLISSGFSLIMGLVMSGVSQKTVRDLRREVDNKLDRLPLKYFDMHPHGDILSRVTNDIDTIAGTLQQSLTQIITSVVSIIGYIIMMLTISPILTLIVIATLPLYILATMMIAKKSQKYFAAQQKELGDLSGHVEEMYTGHKIVKAFVHERESIEKFEATNAKLTEAGRKAQFVSGIMFPVMNFISNLGYVFICIVGGIWITKDLLKLGDIMAFIQYSRSFTMPIVQTANIANIIQSTVACAERVFEVLDEPEEIPDSKDAKQLNDPRGRVEFKHVEFSYTEETPLITDMSLRVNPGDTIAIVGPTGAGKTTLVNLLMRFYEIKSGEINVDGIDIRDIKRSELRKMFGMVLQDTWLFNGTIKDNIAYGRPDATMDEIKLAAKAAHADHFIRTLPEGYNTILNEEATNISQGQKQLLTIARAILANPAILILDEATSSVDTRTEVLIQKAMSNLMQNRTSFVIAHRLSTIRDAEMILVMNHGSIIEMGNHKELLDKGGFYADLYNSQFTGANLEGEAV